MMTLIVETACISRLSQNKVMRKTDHPLYYAYHNMLNRCYNKNNKDYKNYGARGIIVCIEWRQSFELFCTDMGVKPSINHSLDRINNNGSYCKDNCRWATKSQQELNKRPKNNGHGCLTGYFNKKCRCEDCRKFASAYLKNRKLNQHGNK